jgi:hypothetical protein
MRCAISRRRGLPAAVTDSRPNPPGLADGAGAELADATLDMRLGGFDLSLLDGARRC